MKRYFDCQCGKRHIDSTDRSASDKAHNVDRCKECHSKWNGEQVVAHAKEKKRTYDERNKCHAEERRAKAEQLASKIDNAPLPKCSIKQSASARETWARRDKIEEDLELKRINKEYE